MQAAAHVHHDWLQTAVHYNSHHAWQASLAFALSDEFIKHAANQCIKKVMAQY